MLTNGIQGEKMSQISNFWLMAKYNQRMNQVIYEAAAKLDDYDLKLDRGAFFGSIFGTLNHLLVGDIIWLKRFNDHPAEFKSLIPVSEFPLPKALNVIICPELESFYLAREKLDRVIIEFVAELDDEVLCSALCYRNTKGQKYVKNLGALVQHFFNHQTHHRGQVSTLLYQVGIDIGVTDLLIDIDRADPLPLSMT